MCNKQVADYQLARAAELRTLGIPMDQHHEPQRMRLPQAADCSITVGA